VGKRLYVGNLAYSVTEDQLRALFEQVGETEKVTVITDRETGRSKGFGFVEMTTDELAEEAIKRFNGTSFNNRSLTVNEAKPREERPPRSGGYGGGGDRGGYGGGDRGGFGGGDRGGYGGGDRGGYGGGDRGGYGGGGYSDYGSSDRGDRGSRDRDRDRDRDRRDRY
jgi:cold-inducible RNA-binding protein